jgi:hypothetical protein
MQSFIQAITKGLMTTTTTNGADSYTAAGVQNYLLALSFKLVRGLEDASLHKMMQDCLMFEVGTVTSKTQVSSLADLVVMAFQTRDVRGGKGERDLFYKMFLWLYKNIYGPTILETLQFVPYYGSYKDIRELYSAASEKKDTTFQPLLDALTDLMAKQLLADSATPADKSISLAGKWAPREKGANHEFAIKLAKKLFLSSVSVSSKDVAPTRKTVYVCCKKYRQLLTSLNQRLHTIENMMCNGKWTDIDPAAVPANNLKLHRKAFMNVDKKGGVRSEEEDRVACAKRFQEFLEKCKTDPTVAKVHGGVLQPHELVKEYFTRNTTVDDPVIEAQFLDLCRKVQESGKLSKMCVMLDTSGSMTSGSGSVAPILPAMGLTALITRTNHPVFRNFYFRFSSEAEIMRYAAPDANPSLREVVSYMQRDGIVANTNFEKAYKLILKLCVEHKVPEADLPDYLLVLSDMQFDQASSNSGIHIFTPHYQHIQTLFKGAGYSKAPKILFWNLNGNTKDYPASKDAEGVEMISGFSGNLLKYFLDGQLDKMHPTPYDTMRRQLDDERYDPVRKLVMAKYGM